MLYETNYSLQGRLNETLSFFFFFLLNCLPPFPVASGKINQIEYLIYLDTCFLYSDTEKLIRKIYRTLLDFAISFCRLYVAMP